MSFNVLLRNNSGSRRDYVHTYLYNHIIDVSLEPGCALSEKEIGIQLNVSRTPVREAMIQLAREDLVEIVPQIGTFVSLIDPDLVEESRLMKETLEIAVIKLAAEKMNAHTLLELEKSLGLQKIEIKAKNDKGFLKLDDEFHQIIFRSMGKERTWQAIDQMNAQFKRVRLLRLITSETSSWEETLNDHEKLFKALKDKDISLAEKTMKKHLSKCIFHLDKIKMKHPGYFKF